MTDTTSTLTPASLNSANLILAFMFAGDATLTFVSQHTGTRYTYRIQEAPLSDKDRAAGRKAPFFVKYLTGDDNENDYTYLGMVPADTHKFRTTKATKNPTSQPVKGFEWALNILLQGRMPVGLEIWHEGRCGRCNRKLTDPSSIASGFGPECIKMSGGLSGLMAAGAAIISKPVAVPVPPVAPPAPKKVTPADIIAAVNEDPAIKKLEEEVWEKHPANPKNAKNAAKNILPPAAPLPVEPNTAEALARSQGWTVAEAEDYLGRRKIVNLPERTEVSKAEKVAFTAAVDAPHMLPVIIGGKLVDAPAIEAQVNELKATNYDKFSLDGIMDDDEAYSFWYAKLASAAVTSAAVTQ